MYKMRGPWNEGALGMIYFRRFVGSVAKGKVYIKKKSDITTRGEEEIGFRYVLVKMNGRMFRNTINNKSSYNQSTILTKDFTYCFKFN